MSYVISIEKVVNGFSVTFTKFDKDNVAIKSEAYIAVNFNQVVELIEKLSGEKFSRLKSVGGEDVLPKV